jgi:glucose uptake protein GlcU
MACKGFGIAIKLTIEGSNQLVYPSTYFFGVVVGICVVIQMNYFNKALDLFSTNVVTPIYYVFFTTATILASLALFRGFHQASVKDVISAFSGFIVIFVGVFMLNSNKRDNHAFDKLDVHDEDDMQLENRRSDRGFDHVELQMSDNLEDL